MKYCSIKLDKKGKKEVSFGKKWGAMPKKAANASFVQTGDGVYVIDIDTKKVPKKYKKFIKGLGGVPTVETARGYHYYIKSDMKLKSVQNIFDDKEFKVDIRGEGGLIFTDYWGTSDKVWYKHTGKVLKDKKFRFTFLLPSHVVTGSAKKSAGDEVERGDVGEVSLSMIRRMLESVDVKDYSDRDAWMKLLAAIYHGGGKSAEKLARKWSKGDKENYDKESFDDVWGQLLEAKFGTDISVGSLMLDAEDTFEDVSDVEVVRPVVKKVDKRVFDKKGVDWSVIKKIKAEVMKVRGGFEMLNTHGNWAFIEEKHIWEAVYGTFTDPFDNKRIESKRDEINSLMEVKLNEDGGITAENTDTDKVDKVSKLKEGISAMEDYFKGVRKSVIKHIRLYNQYETRHIEIDPFKDHTCIKMVGSDVHVTLCDIFHNVDIKQPDYDTSVYLKDFKKHFSHFNEFMELIVASRFASNRKKAYLHTKMVSDFGKSFLGGIFAQLGLLVEMDMGEMRKAVRGEPSGVNPKDFISAWILQFDEVKYLPAEIKKIYNEITIAAKGQQRMSVPTYMKWLSSAEDIQGMKGVGADKQLANRLSAWDMGDKTLDSRKLFSKDNARYFTALKWEIYMIIRDAVADRVEMGKAKSYKKSQKFITKFHKKYGIEASLDGTVAEFMVDLKERIATVAKTRTSMAHEGVDKLIVESFDVLGGKLIAFKTGSMHHIFTTIAKEKYGNDYKALEYKSGLLREMFSKKRSHIYGKGKSQVRGYKER